MSVKASPLNAAVVLGLVSVMVSTLLAPLEMGEVTKVLATVGGPVTVSAADAAAPLLALVVVTAPVLLVYTPPSAEVTLTVTVQLLLAGIVAPDSCTALPLSTAVTLPIQVVAALALLLLVKPAGYISLNAAPVIAALILGLVRVMVIADVAPALIVAGLKAFVTVGEAGVTVKVLLAPEPIP